MLDMEGSGNISSKIHGRRVFKDEDIEYAVLLFCGVTTCNIYNGERKGEMKREVVKISSVI